MSSTFPKIFKMRASHTLPITTEWREQLIMLLGSKPRRLSRWCELGLFGALSCIKNAGYTQLPNDVAIRVCTNYSTIVATRMALEQLEEGLPMPFTFMQTQPGQIFNALGNCLSWHGDGYTVYAKSSATMDGALLSSCSATSVLFARVDEEPEPLSCWIWLERMECDEACNWQPINSVFDSSVSARWLKIDGKQQIFQGF